MEDKQYLIEAIIPSAKNVAANLGLKGKNIAQWDSIVNNIITAINNDTYNPTSTYSTPKKGVFGYSQESLQSIADQMVAQIKSSKKITSNTTPSLKESKYKDVYDWKEEWSDGYTESIFNTTNSEVFDTLITNVTQALTEIKKLDKTTLLKGFKGKKENIDTTIKTLNTLKGNFNKDTYNKFINILGNLGIDGEQINQYFVKDQSKGNSNISGGNTDLPEDYTDTNTTQFTVKDKKIKYFDNPFEENYGKIIYNDVTYSNLNDFYQKTKDYELAKSIQNEIKKNMDSKFSAYDLNDFEGIYDLDFDENGKYYDVSGVYNIPGYNYVLAKTDDINNFDWNKPTLYGVKDGKIIKITETLDDTMKNWYSIYDTEDFKKLLNPQNVIDKNSTRKINIKQNIERPGLFNDYKIDKNGDLSYHWGSSTSLSTQELAKNYIDNFEKHGGAFITYMLAKGETPTEEDVKDFLLTLYHTVDDNDYKRKALKLMKEYNLKFKNGGSLKLENGNKLQNLKEEADNAMIPADLPQDIVQGLATAAGSASAINTMAKSKKNPSIKNLLWTLGLLGSSSLGSYTAGPDGLTVQKGDVNPNSDFIQSGITLIESLVPRKYKKLITFLKGANLTVGGKSIFDTLMSDADTGDKANSVFRTLSYTLLPFFGPKTKKEKINFSRKNKKSKTKSEPASFSSYTTSTTESAASPEPTTKKLGGTLNYLKVF